MGHQDWAAPYGHHQVPTLPRIQAMTRTIGVWLASPAQPCHCARRACALDQASTGSLAVADTVRRRAKGTPKANQEAHHDYSVVMIDVCITAGADTVSRLVEGSKIPRAFFSEGSIAISVRRSAPSLCYHGTTFCPHQRDCYDRSCYAFFHG